MHRQIFYLNMRADVRTHLFSAYLRLAPRGCSNPRCVEPLTSDAGSRGCYKCKAGYFFTPSTGKCQKCPWGTDCKLGSEVETIDLDRGAYRCVFFSSPSTSSRSQRRSTSLDTTRSNYLALSLHVTASLPVSCAFAASVPHAKSAPCVLPRVSLHFFPSRPPAPLPPLGPHHVQFTSRSTSCYIVGLCSGSAPHHHLRGIQFCRLECTLFSSRHRNLH